MYQQWIGIGNLGGEVELRYTPAGVPVASFSMAVSKKFTNANGEKIEKSTWFKVTAWRALADTVAQYLHKGSKVMVIGELEEARAFTDKSGNNRASLEVTASLVKFLSVNENGETTTTSITEDIPF